MGRLDGRVALVTGAASGIGAAVCRLFVQEGARVALVDLNGPAAGALAAELGPAALAVAADAADPEQMAAAFARAKAAFGPVDILFANAGIDDTSPVEEMPLEQWDRMIRVNLRSVFIAAKLAIPDMKARRWGRIICTASQLAHKGGPTMAHYCAAKAGVLGFVKSLAYEVARDGITVNALCPGPIETPLLHAIPQDWLEMKKAELPAGRFGRVEEVAPAVLLLASEEGSYFVGASMNMNGGDYMI